MSQPGRLNEFSLIQTYFAGLAEFAPGVELGIGDDCALLKLRANQQLAVTVDTSLAGRHFPVDAAPEQIAYRSLAVNLSDLAAMGAIPRWFTLSLTLTQQQAQPQWLQSFSQGLLALAKPYQLSLIGGDTSRGDLAVSIQAMGEVAAGTALSRSTAKTGDYIFVSGSLGDAGAGLELYFKPEKLQDPTQDQTQHREYLLQRYLQPTPRIELGLALRGVASSCLDISDGLMQDLNHICRASALQARIELEKLPLSPALLAAYPDQDSARQLALSAGDDYELCFTVAEQQLPRLERISKELGLPLTCLGRMHSGAGVKVFKQQQEIEIQQQGYQHFYD